MIVDRGSWIVDLLLHQRRDISEPPESEGRGFLRCRARTPNVWRRSYAPRDPRRSVSAMSPAEPADRVGVGRVVVDRYVDGHEHLRWLIPMVLLIDAAFERDRAVDSPAEHPPELSPSTVGHFFLPSPFHLESVDPDPVLGRED